MPPSISGTPQRRQKTPKTASSSATRRSHHSASSRPPATACPATAATTGLVSRSRDGPIGARPSASVRLPRGLPNALRSAPEQNVPPAPNRTATAASSSASKSVNASASAARGRAVDRVAHIGTVEDDGRHRPGAVDPDRGLRSGRDGLPAGVRLAEAGLRGTAPWVTQRRASAAGRVTGPGGAAARGHLADLPGVATGQQVAEIAVALLLPGVVNLGRHQLVVARPLHARKTPIGVCAKSELSSRDSANA